MKEEDRFAGLVKEYLLPGVRSLLVHEIDKIDSYIKNLKMIESRITLLEHRMKRLQEDVGTTLLAFVPEKEKE